MKRPRIVALAGALSLALVLTACSSGASTSSGGSGGATANLTDSQAFLDAALKDPTGIGYDSPVTGQVPTGKHIVVLETPVPVAQVTDTYRLDALALLGWTQTLIVVGNGPEDPAKALDQAIDSKPDAIFYSGYDPNALTTQLARAASEKIPVIVESIPYTAPTADWPAIVGITRNLDLVDNSAKMTAAYLTADSKGEANIELFGVPSQVIIQAYFDSLKKYLAEWCPDCKINVNDFEFTDIGVNLPGQVVSALQRNPKATYAVFGLGDATTGVEAALASAGLSDQVKIGGDIPSPENYAALKAGTQDFWAADTTPEISYKETDMMARAIMGQDLSVVNKAKDITQLLTPDNVGTAVFDDKGYWVGYKDYVSEFKKQWNLG